MLRLAWYIVLAALLLLLEVTAAGWGLLLPSALGLCFYATVSRSWVHGVLLGGLLVVSVEIIMGRQATELVLLPVAVVGALVWRHYGDRRSLVMQTLPGLLLGLAHASFVALAENWGPPGNRLLVAPVTLFLAVLLGAVVGTIGVPLAIAAADAVAAGLGLERFSNRVIFGRELDDA